MWLQITALRFTPLRMASSPSRRIMRATAGWWLLIMVSESPPGTRTFRRSLPSPARASDRKSTRLNSSHLQISYAVFCLKKKTGAQYESESVYHNLKEEWEKLGVIFLDTDSALREHPDIVREYFGTVVPPEDNKLAALNSAVWSGGSFVYVPEGVHVDIPLQAYFRINAQNMGQFERTLIICEPGSYVHYVEGCTAPIYTTDSLHSAVVEIIVKEGARCRYTTIQNWSTNTYNLVTKRAVAYRDATMEWVDGNLGSKLTMKYPSVFMVEDRKSTRLN